MTSTCQLFIALILALALALVYGQDDLELDYSNEYDNVAAAESHVGYG